VPNAAIVPTEADVLLVIDLQNDFCPGGALAVPDGDRTVPVANRLARTFDHVVLTQDWHPPGHSSFASSHDGMTPFSQVDMAYGPQVLWPDHCVQGTPGARFVDGLDIDQAELVLRKGYRHGIDSYSAFYENDRETPTGLSGYLRERGLRRVFLCGLAFDFCVLYSALDARAEGFEAVVIEDGSAAIDLDGSKDQAREKMNAAGVTRLKESDISA